MIYRSAVYTEAEILAQLDACAGTFVIPMLDNGYVYPVDARLRPSETTRVAH